MTTTTKKVFSSESWNEFAAGIVNLKEKVDNAEQAIELTKAEYEALGDSVLTDGKTYYITDADSILFSSEGTVLNVSLNNWVAKSNGTYTNTINVSGISANDIYDINLYGTVTEEQARAYDELVEYIETKNGQVILTASEEITVSFNILLRGKVNLENKNVHIVQELNAGLMEYDNTSSGLEATDLQNAVDEIVRTMFDRVYPVGSIYTSVNNTNPSTIFGGTWEQIKDRFLLSAGDTYTGGSVGGEASHTLTVDEMPRHRHSLMADSTTTTATTDITYALTDHKVEKTATGGSYRDLYMMDYTGGSQAHNNLPPYLAVFVWKRVA